jgi:hypothetical protein
MGTRLSNGQKGVERCMAFERFLLPIVSEGIRKREAKASEFSDLYRETRMSENVMNSLRAKTS